MTAEERLLARLPERPEGGCWIWAGAANPNGYGTIYGLRGTKEYVHRFAYETWVGPIPDGLTIDHVKARGCVSSLCCNPAHLEPVTQSENARRIPRKTHCKHNHEFTPENTRWRARRGSLERVCLTCHRISKRRTTT